MSCSLKVGLYCGRAHGSQLAAPDSLRRHATLPGAPTAHRVSEVRHERSDASEEASLLLRRFFALAFVPPPADPQVSKPVALPRK